MNQQIIDYIKQSRASGMEDSAIKQALLGAGFPASEIEDAIMGKVSEGDALENILNKKPMFSETKAEVVGGRSSILRKLIKVLVIFVVLLAVVVGGYFAVINYLPQYAKYVQPYLGPVLDPVFESVGLPTGVEPVPTPTPTPVPTPTPAPTIIAPLVDTDKDGLFDVDEAVHKTDPNNPDTDGDNYPDGEEVQNGYNPLGPGRATPLPTPPPALLQ